MNNNIKSTPFREFIKRLINITLLLVTGTIGFLITLIIDFWFPNINKINYYSILIGISFVVASYFAFKSLYDEYTLLLMEKNELEDSKPSIEFSFLHPSGSIVKELNIMLGKNPPIPNFDELIEEKRQELLKKSPPSNDGLFLFENDEYFNQIEPYLRRYKEYLRELNECRIDKAFQIFFHILNSGSVPATDITIEIKMPEQYHIPEFHQRFDRKTITDNDFGIYLYEPPEPSPILDSILSPHFPYTPYYDSNNNAITEQSRIQGPEFDEREDSIFIIYRIKKLVQHTNDNNLDPIWIWLGDINNREIWELNAKIFCSELSKPINTKLNIDIVYDENRQENILI